MHLLHTIRKTYNTLASYSGYEVSRSPMREPLHILKMQSMPQVPSDDYMIEHVKSLSSVAGATPSKRTRWPFSAGRKGSGSGLAAVSAR